MITIDGISVDTASSPDELMAEWALFTVEFEYDCKVLISQALNGTVYRVVKKLIANILNNKMENLELRRALLSSRYITVDILKDIKGMVETNLKYAGKLNMNRAMISKDLWDVVCENPDVYNRMQANTDTPKTDMGLQQAFATLIGVEQLNVIDDVEATGLDKVRDVTDYATYSPDFEFKRTLKGLFAMYHYEPTATLQSKCAGVVINVRNRRINYNNGVPIFKTYRHADEGIEGTWIDGRIRAGFHMSNPAGLILATGLLPG